MFIQIYGPLHINAANCYRSAVFLSPSLPPSLPPSYAARILYIVGLNLVQSLALQPAKIFTFI